MDVACVLLTYNGPWGIIPHGNLQHTCSEEELVQYVRRLPCALDLWDRFQNFVRGAADNVGASTYGMCFEICLETWKEKHVLRLHAHVFCAVTGARFVFTVLCFLHGWGSRLTSPPWLWARILAGVCMQDYTMFWAQNLTAFSREVIQDHFWDFPVELELDI